MRGPLLAAALLAGCAAAERGGEDAAVVATFPFHAVTTPGGLFAESYRRDPGRALGTAPLMLPLYFVGDVFFTGVSAVDAALSPAYAPFEVKPLNIYRLDTFPPRIERRVVAGSGETVATTIVFLSPIAGFIAVISGHGPPGSWTYPSP